MHKPYRVIVKNAAAVVRRGLVVLSFLALLSAASNALAAGQSSRISGDFSLIGMAHTPNWPKATNVTPWDGKSDGAFVYRALPCSSREAHVNNNSSNLPSYNTRIPGSRSPASTRSHPMQLTVEKGNIEGKVTLIICKLAPGPTSDGVPDEKRERIFIEFKAASERFTAEELTFRGSFRITGGTGQYNDLAGEGNIHGYFFCYERKGCSASGGQFRDVLFTLQGRFLHRVN